MDENKETISIYKEGDFTDLCTGPHLPSAGKIKYVKLLNISGSYWRGDEKNKQLQRIYGISFPKKKMLDDYLFCLKKLRKEIIESLVKNLSCFLFLRKVGPGFRFGCQKAQSLGRLWKTFYVMSKGERGYLPVITPHIGNINLYKTSGHYPYYSDSQFPSFNL